MGSSIFKYGEAQRWQAAVEQLNDETDALLKEVAQCIEEVSNGCEGSVVEELKSVAEGLLDKFSQLIQALVNLIGALADIIRGFQDFEDTVIDNIVSIGKAVLGGLS